MKDQVMSLFNQKFDGESPKERQIVEFQSKVNELIRRIGEYNRHKVAIDKNLIDPVIMQVHKELAQSQFNVLHSLAEEIGSLAFVVAKSDYSELHPLNKGTK